MSWERGRRKRWTVRYERGATVLDETLAKLEMNIRTSDIAADKKAELLRFVNPTMKLPHSHTPSRTAASVMCYERSRNEVIRQTKNPQLTRPATQGLWLPSITGRRIQLVRW
jgi:hypothetical protein